MSNTSIWERLDAMRAVFDQLGSLAEIELMPEPQRTQYEQSLKVYRDTLSILKTERAEGYAEGYAEVLSKFRAEGEAKVAKKMKDGGLDYPTISKYTGLSLEEIARL